MGREAVPQQDAGGSDHAASIEERNRTAWPPPPSAVVAGLLFIVALNFAAREVWGIVAIALVGAALAAAYHWVAGGRSRRRP